MKPVNAKENPGLAKLPTSVRNKMGYMKKGGLTKPNGSKRMKKFDNGGAAEYKGDDEIVKYRMGQLKDPGIDLFKLVRGEEQVAKPVQLDKKPAEIKTETKTVTTPIIEAGVEEEKSVRSKPVETAREQTFGEAFKSARAGGGKTFTFNGKSYTTELAKPKPKETAYNAAAAEESYASSMEKSNPDYRAVMKRLNSPEFKLAKESGAIQGTPFEDFEREDRIIKNQKSLMGKKKGGEIKSPTMSFQTYSKTGKKTGMKTVKMASGGKVSSASSRGDGCAVRGKTRA